MTERNEMQTFVKLRPAMRLTYVNLSATEGTEVAIEKHNYALDVKGKALVNGESVNIVQPNQTFTLDLGVVAPRRYTCMIVTNHIIQNASIGPTVMMLEAGEVVDLKLNFKALRKLDLTELQYCVRIYLVD